MAAAAPDGPPKNDAIDSDTTQDGRQDPEKAVPFEDAADESGTRSPPPAQQLPRWNDSPVNILRYLTTNYCFVLMGMTDGALGVRFLPLSKPLLLPLLYPPSLANSLR
jgi:hypothetical protein